MIVCDCRLFVGNLSRILFVLGLWFSFTLLPRETLSVLALLLPKNTRYFTGTGTTITQEYQVFYWYWHYNYTGIPGILLILAELLPKNTRYFTGSVTTITQEYQCILLVLALILLNFTRYLLLLALLLPKNTRYFSGTGTTVTQEKRYFTDFIVKLSFEILNRRVKQRNCRAKRKLPGKSPGPTVQLARTYCSSEQFLILFLLLA